MTSTLATIKTALTRQLEGEQKLKEHETMSEDLKKLRFSLRTLEKDYDKSEDDIKALQSVGQIIGEVLKALDEERCAPMLQSTASLRPVH